MKENWVNLYCSNKYQISDQGRLRSTKFKKVLSLNIHDIKKWDSSKRKSSYKVLTYSIFDENKKHICLSISNAVWKSFNGEIKSGYFVSFKDKNTLNCKLDNLYLRSRKDAIKESLQNRKIKSSARIQDNFGNEFYSISQASQFYNLNYYLIRDHSLTEKPIKLTDIEVIFKRLDPIIPKNRNK